MYKKRSQEIAKDLQDVLSKHKIEIDDGIDHISVFLAKWVMKSPEDNRLVNAMNIIHSFSRYVMALEIDSQGGIYDP